MDHYLDLLFVPAALLLICAGLTLLIGTILSRGAAPASNAAIVPPELPTAPGQSLLRRFCGLNTVAHIYTAQLIGFPLLLWASFATYLVIDPHPIHWIEPLLPAVGFVALEVYFSLGLKRTATEYDSACRSYENKLITGQAISAFSSSGYAIFHDFHHGDVIVDHLLVGPKGIFAIQTITHESPPISDDPAKCIVQYNGRVLHFGENQSNHQAIDRAEATAEALSEWLSEPLEEPVAARAILSLPGWAVKRIAADGMPAVNPTQFASLFEYIVPRQLSPEMIAGFSQRIAATYLRPAANDKAPTKAAASN